MSLLIKGMEMPKSCAECLDIGWHYVFECHLDDMEDGERLPSCPLVPVPPHGRLIDADALMKQIEHDTPLSAVFEKTMRRYLLNAPTIIEADGGDAQ